VDTDAGIPRANSGTAANINDDDVGTRVDTWFGADPTGVGQGVSYVGILWPSPRYDNVTQLTLYLALFGDGGWFGANGAGPGPDGILTPDHLVEPTIQVTTDHGTNWTSVAASSDYMTVMNGMPIGGPVNGTPLQATATFTLNTPASLINGIRIIGPNGGDGVDVNGFLGVFELAVESAPSADTDSDGLPDSWETANGLNVGSDDSALDADGDGLTNLQEYTASTNPKQADSDSDGLDDATEVNISLTNPNVADTDGDGLTDGQEVNTTHSDPKLVDTDSDGLSDGDEVNLHGTDPTLADTDNDGYSDAVEVAQGSDPSDPTSLPNNLSLTGHGLLGVKEAVDSGAEVERYHVGAAENIVDGSTNTRVDTWNGDDASTLPYTASFVGVIWDAPITDAVASLKLTLATFVDGGWFGPNGVGPSAGGALTTAYLTAPRVEVTADGFTWTPVDATSDYVTALTGHKIGGGSGPNPTFVSATFTLAHATNGILGIRLIGTEGGAASGGFIGVVELSALSSSTDVDNDGMDDTWERQNGLVVGTNDASGDPDADGLTNLQEFNANTNPKVADTDGDGLNDGAEINTHHTDPARADSDADGLSDGAEVNTHHSNPLALDTDSDGFSDGLEVTLGTDPANASSKPDNIALLGTAIIGTRESAESGVETPHANAGAPAAINDANLESHVDTWNNTGTDTASYVGILWSSPITNEIKGLELTLATFLDGGWFGPNNSGPGAGLALTADQLAEPAVQVTTDGTTWNTVGAASDYVSALTGHLIGGGGVPNPSSVSATFTLSEPQTNIRGIRLIGTEGGTASGGFIGVYELAVKTGTTVPPSGLQLTNAAIVANHFQFQVNTTSGVSHEVQYKNSLSDTTWQSLTTITGDGTPKTVADTNAIVSHRFYRIVN
jgi:hypothetical protein